MYFWSYISIYRPFSVMYLTLDLISPAHSLALVCFHLPVAQVKSYWNADLISLRELWHQLLWSSGLWLVSLYTHWPLIGQPLATLASDWRSRPSASGKSSLYLLPPLLQWETQTQSSWQIRNRDNFSHSFRNSYGSSLYLLSVLSELSLLDLKQDSDL